MKPLNYSDAVSLAESVSKAFPDVLVQIEKDLETSHKDGNGALFIVTLGAPLHKSYGYRNGRIWYGESALIVWTAEDILNKAA